MLRISFISIFIASACTDAGMKNSPPPQDISSPLEAADALEMQACNQQKKFYDPEARICELKIGLATYSCDRDGISQQKGMNFYQDELTQIDDLRAKGFFFFECGQSEDRSIVMLAKTGPTEMRRFDFLFDGSKRSGDVTAKQFGDARIDAMTFSGATNCSAVKSGNEITHHEKRSLKLSLTKSFEMKAIQHKKEDSTCVGQQKEMLLLSGAYSIGNILRANVREVYFDTKKVTLTVWDPTAISEANAVGRCGKTNWQSSVAQEIINAPSCSWNVNLAARWFQILSVAEMSLQMGLVDVSHLGATEAARPTEIDATFTFTAR